MAVLDRFYCTAFPCKSALVEQNDLNLSDILVPGQVNRYFLLVRNEMGPGLRQARHGISTSHKAERVNVFYFKLCVKY